jgi:hypothetical protein
MDLITANAHAMCEKAVDKVWGMHSLAKSCCKTAVPVSYSTPLFIVVGRVLHHDLVAHETGSLKNMIVKARRLNKIFLERPVDQAVLNEEIFRFLGHSPADFVPPPLLLSGDITPSNVASLCPILIRTSAAVRGSIVWFGDESLLWPAHSPEDSLNDATQVPRAVLESVLSLGASFELTQSYPSYPRRESLSKSVSYGTISTYCEAQRAALGALEPSAIRNAVMRDVNTQSPSNTQSSSSGWISAIFRKGMQQVGASRKSSDRAKVGNRGQIFGTASGLIGLAPENARLGDLVCEYGTRFCLIVREVDRIFQSEKKMEVQIFEICTEALIKRGTHNIFNLRVLTSLFLN